MSSATSFDAEGFSVVTPTRGRLRSALRVLAGLADQDYPHDLIEVLVILDGPDEEAAAVLRGQGYPFRLSVWQQPVRGPAAARNLGLRVARAPFVLFLDDDVIPDAHLVSAHRAAHGDDRSLVVIGPLLAPAEGKAPPWISWEWSTLAEQYRAMLAGEWAPTPRQFYTGNASVRRDHLLAVGGFNEAFKRGEDVELAWRLHSVGLRFVFEPNAIGTHLARRSYRKWLTAAREYGRTDVMLERIRTGQSIPPWVLKEFVRRNPHTRRLALAGVRSPWLLPVARVTGAVALAVTRVTGTDRAHQLCSGLFTMNYWSGVADQLDSADELLGLLRRQGGSPSTPPRGKLGRESRVEGES